MTQKNELSNVVYVGKKLREELEVIVTEIGYKRNRVLSAPAFVRYLIEEFGEDAKIRLLRDN